MPDLKLGADGDLAIVAGDLALTDDASGESVAQMIWIRLRHHYGEWFLDTRRGVRYRERVFVKNPDLAAIESMLKVTILETPGVRRLREYTQTLNRETRDLTVRFRAELDDGTTITEREVLSA